MEPTTNESSIGSKPLLGAWLVERGLISYDALTKALEEQHRAGGRLGEVVVRLEMLDRGQLTQALAEYLEVDYTCLEDLSNVDVNYARLIPEPIAKRFAVVALREEDDEAVVAMADPLDIVAIDTVSRKLGRRLKVVISGLEEIRRAIELIYHGSGADEQLLRDLVELELDAEDQIVESIIDESATDEFAGEEAASKAPVIRFVDLLLNHAVKRRASDIHIEPQERSMSIRMRIDGLLRDMVPPPRRMQAAIVARVKILSQIDIAERRLPQDGRFKVRVNRRNVDVRVSTFPTIYGQKVVMRILDASAVNHDLDQLGLAPELLEEFKSILSKPQGIVVVVGPTGSGKSTTLYSALNYLRDSTRNITTVEDPVEYRLAGTNQGQVKPEIGLDFAKCLRAILRQDPDIILIGEIRDKETVEVAMRASLTGHLVLSTFHTNDAASAVSRFVYMGIERYLLAATLNLIVAQRLVRKICDRCKEPVEHSGELLRYLEISPEQMENVVFYHGQGCSACEKTGYLGRLPIFEFLVVDHDLREELAKGAGEPEIRAVSRQKGYAGLVESGVGKILEGLTTPEEILRVAFA
jgi:type IV pilus assembly protein PilB